MAHIKQALLSTRIESAKDYLKRIMGRLWIFNAITPQPRAIGYLEAAKANFPILFTREVAPFATGVAKLPIRKRPMRTDPGISGITGGVTVIPSVKESESNEDFGGWEYGFDNYPHAEEV